MTIEEIMTRGAPVLSYASILEQAVRDQVSVLAEMPFIFPHIALMPDAHAGKGSSVGTVIPTRRAVIPAAVGVDIGCGMIAAKTSLFKDDIAGFRLGPLRHRIENAIPLSAGNYNDDDAWKKNSDTRHRIERLEAKAERDGVDLSHSPKWREQLGTLGSGNHFIEACFDQNNQIWLFLHSGSRGVGNKIAQRHIKIAQDLCNLWHIPLAHKDLAYLPQGTPQFTQYLKDLNWAQQFALLNREEMMDRFALEFTAWVGGSVAEEERINCHHNYTEPVTIRGEKVWLTRKGAIDASFGSRGVIPGSMGTRSYVVTGKGDATALASAPHGAGRVMSRSKAKKAFTPEDLDIAMAGIEYRSGEQFLDEHPKAYKDIDVVMEDAKSMVAITHTLRQFVNVKGD
ncbi:RtcB-like RNA ligase [Rhodococcus phage Trogglehumper]|uniref:3'-phosphate/5'-hydroxy nucleic acid ligase n=1 Tax=Rhodococcus phage Trogglehumper TaxID=3038381 RepID=A0AAF0GK13_9CAUD|nr:RtcB-like RNA ligase [Rhodococcus phage Trogglehumper]